MLSKKCMVSLILALVLILSPTAITNADDAINTQQMIPAPITIVGKDVASHQTVLQVPTKDQSTHTKGEVFAQGVIVGGNGAGIPVADVEWSYFSYDPDDWWNPLDGGNRLQGSTGQSIAAVDPRFEAQVPAIKFQMKNTVWINGSYRTSAPSTTVYAKFWEVSAPWVSNLSKGDSGACNGFHKMYDTYGMAFVDTSTLSSYAIP